MSDRFPPSDRSGGWQLSPSDRAHLAFLLASCVRRRRQQLGLSLERAAELSGMQISEWCALEAGWVPEQQSNLLHAIAGTLEACYLHAAFIAEISREHQSHPV